MWNIICDILIGRSCLGRLAHLNPVFPPLPESHHQTHSLPLCNSEVHAFLTYSLVITKHTPSSPPSMQLSSSCILYYNLVITDHTPSLSSCNSAFHAFFTITWSSPNTLPPALPPCNSALHAFLKPVLNWVNVCSLNILRTV